MIENIERIREEARSKISTAPGPSELEKLRIHYLGKKGLITNLLHQLKDLDADKKRELGAVLNQIKSDFDALFSDRQGQLEQAEVEKELTKSPPLDLSLPGLYMHSSGSFHPVSRVIREATDCLKRVGFSLASGPEVETEYFNFEALNIPADHPARDMQATFFVNPPVLLRTHTSPMQIRTMKHHNPPVQVIAVGRVYRSDYDATHTPMFHQIEGFMVDEGISFADLKGILYHLVKNLFGERPLRFRPSYFPFTEPSAEVDMQCIACRGGNKECRLCGSSGWIEIGGCGMIHPNVMRSVNYDPDKFSGFAFGMGVERIAMLKYGMDDLRALFENDHRMLEQF